MPTVNGAEMKRNLSLLKEILQLRLDAEIAAATRELNYAHGTERQLSDPNEKHCLHWGQIAALTMYSAALFE